MAEQNDHIKQYSAVDIEKYHSGEMPAHEMHQLEKAALDDPFLADALEGYQYTNRPVEDSNGLRKELQSRLSSGKVVVMRKDVTKKQVLKIAVLFFLIAGTAWMAFQFGFMNTDKNIAVQSNDIQERLNPTDTASVSTTETSASSDISSQAEVQSTLSPKTNGNTNSTATRKSISPSAPVSETEAATIDMGRSHNANSELTEVLLERRQAFIQSAPRDTSNTIGYGIQRTIPSNNNEVVVMQRATDTAVQDVLLSKSRNDSAARRRTSITFEGVEPEKGGQYYNDYFVQNLNIPEEIKIKNTSGEVQLSFDVNALGNAVNIKVERSLCDGCDKEAIRLLKEGPKWVQKNGKKGKFKLRF